MENINNEKLKIELGQPNNKIIEDSEFPEKTYLYLKKGNGNTDGDILLMASDGLREYPILIFYPTKNVIKIARFEYVPMHLGFAIDSEKYGVAVIDETDDVFKNKKRMKQSAKRSKKRDKLLHKQCQIKYLLEK